MAKFWCENCECETETKVIRKIESWKVLGESIEYETDVRICAVCGEEIFDDQLDDRTMKAVYNIYRSNHGMLSAEEIKDIRLKYGLSQRTMAKLLGWSDKTVARYENGSLPDKAHHAMLRTISTAAGMRNFLAENKTSLTDTQMEKLKTRLDEIDSGLKYPIVSDADAIIVDSPSLENGFKAFDYEKFAAATAFFAKKFPNLGKTKLLKLLYYSDTSYFQKNVISITGSKYLHYPFGPVPDQYDRLLGQMEKDGIIKQNSIYMEQFDDFKTCIVPQQTSEVEDVLSSKEKAWLQKVGEAFRGFNVKEISEYSHGEEGYVDTKLNDVISYSYARNLRPLPEGNGVNTSNLS